MHPNMKGFIRMVLPLQLLNYVILWLLCGSVVSGQHFMDSASERILEKYDESGDGFLNRHEFEELFIASLSGEGGHGHSHSHSESEHEPEYSVETDEDNTFECYLVADLFQESDSDHNGLLSAAEIKNVTPAMIFNVVNKCKIIMGESTCSRSTPTAVWVGSIVSSIIVSLISLGIVVLTPLGRAKIQQYVLSPLVSFATGALLGDAILHLIPEILGVHSHDDEGHHEEEAEQAYLAPMSVVLLTILLFFIMERQLEHFHTHNHSQGEETANDVLDVQMSVASMFHSIISTHTHRADKDRGSKEESGESDTSSSSDTSEKQHKTFGYLSLFADGVHNFTDGMAIGAAFSVSVGSGIATTLAVVCHEIPQELGDFAILIKAGFSKKFAVIFNFLSGLTCIIGVFIGAGVGTSVTEASKYILAFTTGGFLYVALGNMIPELHKEKGSKNTMWQVGFLVLGYGVMVILSLYLEHFSFCI